VTKPRFALGAAAGLLSAAAGVGAATAVAALVVALAIFLVGCIGCAAAPDIWTLIAFRMVSGAAGAVFPLSFGIIRDEFPPDRVKVGIGLLSAVFGIGGGFGLVLGGAGSLVLLYLTAVKLAGEAIGHRPLLTLGVLLVVVGMQFLSLGLLSELITSHHEERSGVQRSAEQHVDEILR